VAIGVCMVQVCAAQHQLDMTRKIHAHAFESLARTRAPAGTRLYSRSSMRGVHEADARRTALRVAPDIDRWAPRSMSTLARRRDGCKGT